jgi:hypothetical protein
MLPMNRRRVLFSTLGGLTGFCLAIAALRLSHVLGAAKGLVWYFLVWFAFLWAAMAMGRLFGVKMDLRLTPQQKIKDATRDVGSITRFREWLGGWVYMASTTVAWPILVLRLPLTVARFRRRGTLRVPRRETMQADMRLRPRVLFDSVAVAIITAGAYALTVAGLIPFVLAFFVLSAGFSTLTLAAFTIGPGSFPEQLRRAAGRPHLNLLMLTLAISSTVLISFLALRFEGHLPEAGQVSDLLVQMTPGQAARTLLAHPFQQFLEVEIAVTGLLLCSSLLTGLWKFKEYRREDRHHESMAESYIRLGAPTNAIECLRKVRNPSQSTCVVSTAAYLCVNRIDRALDAARNALALQAEVPLTLEAYAFACFAALEYPVPAYVTRELLLQWIQKGGGDAQMLFVVAALLERKIFAPAEIQTLFPAGTARRQFPLAYVGSLITIGRTNAAQRLLRRTDARTAIEAALKEFLELLTTISAPSADPERGVIFIHRWLRRNAVRFTALAGELPHEFDRLISFTISGIVASICKEVAPEKVEEWRFINDQHRESLRSDQVRRAADAFSIDAKVSYR